MQADSKDVFGEGRGGVDVIQELVDKVNAQVGVGVLAKPFAIL